MRHEAVELQRRNEQSTRVYQLLSALRAFAVAVFVGLGGLAVATLLVSRGPIPAEISGSPTPPEHLPRTVSNVLADGDFVTRAADGEAHVLIRYSSPEAFTQLIHVYRSEVWPQYRINTAALQQSDDGTNWTDVAEAGELNGEIAFDLRKAGAHKFWKMTVVKSGDAPEVVFGQLSFVPNQSIIQQVPVDVVWLGLLPALVLILLAFQIPLSFGWVFTATALPVALFMLLYSLGYVNVHTLTSPDALQYLQRTIYGSYSPLRNVGYPTILLAVQNTVGLDHLAWIQLGTEIACYLAGAFLLAVRFANKWVGPILVLAVLLQGTISLFAPDVMSEALFTAGLGLFAPALGVLAWRPDRRAVSAAAVGIILATLAKSLGVVLVLPALLLVRFLPRGHRLSVSGTIVICGLGTYALMAINSYVRTGIASPETIAGYALVAQVGGMLDDASMPPSDLTRRLIGAVAPVIEKRPADLTNIHSLETLDRYVDVTTQDFNVIIWEKLAPIANSELGSLDRVNSFFLRFGLSSIRAHPFSYLRHVTAHFYGMWRELGRTLPLRTATVYVRRLPVLMSAPFYSEMRSEIPATVITPYPSEDVLKGEVIRQSNLPLMLEDVWSAVLISDGWTVALGTLAVALSILFLVPGRLACLYRTEIMIALSVNAYFGAHVLLQVSLHRYAWPAVFAAIFLTASFVLTSCYALKSMLAAWASAFRKGRATRTGFRGRWKSFQRRWQ